MNLVNKALVFGANAHKDQTRTDGSPYFFHPIRVYQLLVNKTKGQDILCAALLHDVIEDCGVTKETIANEFNLGIAQLVDELTNKYSDYLEHNEKLQATYEHCRHLSSGAIYVKLADRWDNLNDLKNWKPARILRYCENTDYLIKGLQHVPIDMVAMLYEVENQVEYLREKYADFNLNSGNSKIG